MSQTFLETIKKRRSYYALSNKSSISDAEIQKIIENALLHVPSAFNSQTTRVILLLGDNHKKLWEITKSELKKLVSEEAFKNTENKINTSFESGYGTILFFEDQAIVESLQKQFPTYSDNFPVWSEQTSGMHQFAIWSMLEETGLGATLQHYNPVIDKEVEKTWKVNPKWKLRAQMPFGIPTSEAGKKEFGPLEDRLKVFK